MNTKRHSRRHLFISIYRMQCEISSSENHMPCDISRKLLLNVSPRFSVDACRDEWFSSVAKSCTNKHTWSQGLRFKSIESEIGFETTNDMRKNVIHERHQALCKQWLFFSVSSVFFSSSIQTTNKLFDFACCIFLLFREV